MPPLKFEIQPPDTVALPVRLILGPLTLAEIGAVFVWGAAGQIGNADDDPEGAGALAAVGLRDARLTSAEFLEASRSLARLKVLSVVAEGTAAAASLNLNAVMPPESYFPIT